MSGNRLAGETSPYLLLHAHNPVDWYPWGEEALRRAREEDKPIFLSVGYSTCYWCHVMERESFSDPAIAELMNRHFVNVKLDREERPELDEIYMTATQLYTQQGGWPNSVFLTPKLEPFFAGTYFPPDDRYGRPGFVRVLASLADAWVNRRADVELQAEELAGAMRRVLEERGEPGTAVPGPEAARRSLGVLARGFDPRHGGFGGAPKFPSPANLYLLDAFADEDGEAASMLAVTLDRMARGGIWDQLGGGFHRYATDREWKVPHFEKMLYDNAHLIELYARHARRAGDPEAKRVVRGIFGFLERELSAPEGGFWSAVDAEVAGHEGAYHVWTREEIDEALGEEDALFLAPILGFDGPPFFEGPYYVLHQPAPLAEQAARRGLGRDELLAQIEPLAAKLLAARDARTRPLVDDKVLTDWNGMMIAGLAVAGRLLDDGALVERAARAADFVLASLRPEGGPLRHTWRRGEARIPAFLADYACLVRGLIALHEATGEERWLRDAEALTDEQAERLGDPRGGFFTAGEAPDRLLRSKEIFDGALPSANAVAVLNLVALGRRAPAEAALRAFAPFVENQPEGARMACLAVRRHHERWGGDPLAAEARQVVAPELAVDEPGAGGWRPFRLRLVLRKGWHLYPPGIEPPLEPVALGIRGGELRSLAMPPASRRLADDAGGVEVYEGEIEIRGELRGGGPGRLVLAYQPCDAGRCLARTEVEIPYSVP